MNDQFKNDSLTIAKVRLSCSVVYPITWNSFPGSVIHGVLGYHLRKLACIRPGIKCGSCELVHSCPYSVLMEPHQTERDRQFRQHSRNPSPMRLVIYPWDRNKLEVNERVIIELTFVGRAVGLSKLVVLALSEAFTEGVGRKDEKGLRGVLSIDRIDLPFWNKEISFEGVRYDKITGFTFWEALNRAGRYDRLAFITPTRIVERGKVQAQPSLSAIVKTVLRRVTGLAFFHCGVELDVNYHEIAKIVDSISYIVSFNRYHSHRYSSRQQQDIRIDGAYGIVLIDFVPNEMSQWLTVGSYFGCGKGTTVGYGEYIL